MCYYNGIQVSKQAYISLQQLEKQIQEAQTMRPLINGFEYGEAPVLLPTSGKKDFEIVMAHWEFIPYWLKTMKEVEEQRKKYTTLNAVGEKLLESKIYREAALKRRCLVLSSGFYEWRHYKKQTFPYHITLKDKAYFFMAGIYQPWTDKESGEHLTTFAIVTTEANPLMQLIHNTKKRMPTILPEQQAYEWLLGDISEQRVKELATYQIAPTEMQYHTIAKDFRSALDPLKEFQYESLPELDL